MGAGWLVAFALLLPLGVPGGADVPRHRATATLTVRVRVVRSTSFRTPRAYLRAAGAPGAGATLHLAPASGGTGSNMLAGPLGGPSLPCRAEAEGGCTVGLDSARGEQGAALVVVTVLPDGAPTAVVEADERPGSNVGAQGGCSGARVLQSFSR